MINLFWFHLMLQFICLIIIAKSEFTLELKNIVFVILSQPNRFHIELAEKLKSRIEDSIPFIKESYPVVHLSHLDFPHEGNWLIVPILKEIVEIHGRNSSWIVFVEDTTYINTTILYNTLKKYDPNNIVWLGYAVFDKENVDWQLRPASLHQNVTKYMYPLSSPGFVMSTLMADRLAKRFLNPRQYQFKVINCYMSYELSCYTWTGKSGVEINHEPSFCPTIAPSCSSYPMYPYPCKVPVPLKSVFFAVRTFSQNHESRVSVLKNTWAKSILNVKFFSDLEDKDYGTISLGIPNQRRGYCASTMAVIMYMADIFRRNETLKWLFIADDDTILSVNRVREILTCYDSNDYVALGERFGYNTFFKGYNYLTGGGGFIWSRSLLLKVANENRCLCEDNAAPDDIFIGKCLYFNNISLTHSPLFHQDSPDTYPKEYLAGQKPVSFHRIKENDPYGVYKKWFLEVDEIHL